jgi:hypothetical protein
MKKLYFLVLVVAVALIASGCGQNKKEMMDEINEKGYFHYTNDDLGFGFYLPREFIYYQTQRKDNDNFTDIEIWVPTTDSSAYGEVSGYTKPVTIRIFKKKYWNSSMDGQDKKDYEKIGENKDNVYTMLFWTKTSADWSQRWTEDMKKDLVEKFQIK